jgi:hypothetical protein
VACGTATQIAIKIHRGQSLPVGKRIETVERQKPDEPMINHDRQVFSFLFD